MSVHTLVLYHRKSHESTYGRFRDFCSAHRPIVPTLIPYPLTIDDAVRLLETAHTDLTLLECALPMAMRLVSRKSEFRIAGFLDVANMKHRRSSCSIYYHRSVELDKDLPRELLVPSLLSMTTVSAAIYLKKCLASPNFSFRTFVDENDDPYDRIICTLADAAGRGEDLTALKNFCTLLSRELTRISTLAGFHNAELSLSTQVIEGETGRAAGNSIRAAEIRNRLQNDNMAPDLSGLQEDVLRICREARRIEATLTDAFGRLPRQAERALAALDRTSVERTRTSNEAHS